MPALNVGGSTVPVAPEGGMEKHFEEIGDRSRAPDGSVRQSIRNRPRSWRGRTAPMSSGDAYALAVSLSCTPPQTAYGTLMPTTATSVYPELLGQTIIVGATGQRIVVKFALHESS